MAISILVKSKTGDYEVPIATQDLFESVWRPLSASLGLKLVPQFTDNFRVDVANLAAIEEEIDQFRKRILTTDEKTLALEFGILRPGDKSRLMERLDLILVQIRQLRDRTDWEAWIG